MGLFLWGYYIYFVTLCVNSDYLLNYYNRRPQVTGVYF